MVSDIRLCTCVSFLSLSPNLGRHARGCSSSHMEAVHEPHPHLRSFAREVLRAHVRRVRSGTPPSTCCRGPSSLEPPPLVVASAELVAAMLSCFVQTLIRCLPCKIMHPTDRFPRLCVFCPIRVSKGVQGNCMSLPLKQTPNSWFSNKESAKSVRAFSSLVRPTETSLSTVSCWRTCCRASGDKQVSPRRDRTEHGDLLRPQLRGRCCLRRL